MTPRRADVVVDCRWLGYSGVGRVTELLLRGLLELRPGGDWLLWGPPPVEELAWPGARPLVTTTSPTSVLGQRELLAVPRGGRTVWLNAVRPLVPDRDAVVLVHDTIPLRWPGNRVTRLGRRLLYVLSTRTAGFVLVYSDATSARVRADLGISADRIRRVHLPIDLSLADRVLETRRRSRPDEDLLLYVGLHRRHKNLERAIRAFARTKLARSGGRFRLVGLDEPAVAHLASVAAGCRGVELVGRCADEELIRHYADATAVIQPSLEEGLGLTVIEALAGGVPACCSAGGALAEASGGFAETFDPLSVDDMAEAIDRTVETAHAGVWDERLHRFRAEVPIPTPRQFAESVIDVLGGAGPAWTPR